MPADAGPTVGPSAGPMTGASLCEAARLRLEAAGVDGAGRDATLLFAAALGDVTGQPVARHHVPAHLHAEASGELVRRYDALVARRAARQPLSQIIGRRAFWNHDFHVTSDTLDPRPETELLVELALREPFDAVLDLGTGTGAILISLMAERPGIRGLGTDLSAAALAVAGGNAARIGVAAQFVLSDWFGAVEGRFGLIVSNPPYIARDEMAGLAPEVREWEPRMALTDEADGLSAYRAITRGAGAHLLPGARLMVEIGPTQGSAVAALFSEAGLGDIAIHRDLDGRDRVVSGRNPA